MAHPVRCTVCREATEEVYPHNLCPDCNEMYMKLLEELFYDPEVDEYPGGPERR